MIFHFGGKQYNYIRKDSLADYWTDRGKTIWNRSFQYFFKLLGIVILIFLYLPLLKDMDNAIHNNYIVKEVKIEKLTRQNLYPTSWLVQVLEVGGEEYLCFGFGKFKESSVYQLNCLPRTNFVIDAQQKK